MIFEILYGHLGLLCSLYESFILMHESLEDEAATLDVALFGWIKKAIMLVQDTSAQVSSKCCGQILSELNPVLASLGKEDFPDSGTQLFGDGFEAT